MKTKILLTALTWLITLQFTYAQYLVSATFLHYRNASQIEILLTDLGYDVSSMDLNAAEIYKITYNTIDVFGDPTIASGALYVPQVDCDTLPLVSDQHGTEFEKIHVPSDTWYYDSGFMFSANGFITTQSDFLGLGDNPGLHPYMHWESEATASIDLIRASREFLMDSLGIWDNNQLFLTGYSQGGHASMAIHKYIADNNLQSEFNVVASAPMSGTFPLYDAQFSEMFNEDPTYYTAEFVPYTIGSYQMIYGNLYENPNEYYDPPYDLIIPEWLSSGTHTYEEWAELIPKNFYDFMQDSVVDNITNNPNHPFNIDLRLNDLHNWVPDEPIRMLYCGMDSMVFPQNSTMTLDTMKALGATQVDALNLDWYGTHETCQYETIVYAAIWFDSLNAGCNIVTPYCMPNGATFSTQAEIDNFPIYHPFCIEIGGDVVINGNDITNLDSLISLKSIDGDLEIHTNEVLENLSGLDSLGSINGNFKVYLNDILTDFTGLENLGTIGDKLVVAYNPLLTSLTGLDNIDPGSIDDLTISNNDKLSYCEVESICEYLVTTEGNVKIHDNAPGCNSQDEVELACAVSVDEAQLPDKLFIYPNPSSTQITIELPNTPQKDALLTIYSMNSQRMLTSKITEQKTVVDVSGLRKGFYFVKVADDRKVVVGKMVKK